MRKVAKSSAALALSPASAAATAASKSDCSVTASSPVLSGATAGATGRGRGPVTPPPSGSGLAERAGVAALELGQAELDVADLVAWRRRRSADVVGQHVDPVGQPPELRLELVEPGQRRRRLRRQAAGRAAAHQLVAQLLDLAVEHRQLGPDVGQVLRRAPAPAKGSRRGERQGAEPWRGSRAWAPPVGAGRLADQAPAPPVTTVTARRFCAKQLSSGQVATGRSRPKVMIEIRLSGMPWLTM